MRKLTVLLLSVMVIMALFVSCTVEVNEDTGDTVTLRFTTDEAEGMRSLSASKTTFSAADYVWYYTATKSVQGTPSSGSTTKETLVGENGELASVVGSFSLGKWNFALYGYTGTVQDKGQLAYKGSVNNVEINSSTSSVPITVEPVKTADGTGTLVITNTIKFTVGDDEFTANYCKVTSVISDGKSDADYVDIGNGRLIEDLPSDVYKVEVAYKNSEGDDADIVYTYATNFIYVNVWNGQKTTVSGYLDEATKYTQFDATENVDGSYSQICTIAKSDSEQTLAFTYSPSALSNPEDSSSTTIKGTFTVADDQNTGALTLTLYGKEAFAKSSVQKKFAAGIAENAVAEAALEISLSDATLSLDVAGQGVIPVTVETYITKNINSNYIYMSYIDSSGKATSYTKVDTEGELTSKNFYYDSSTGKLVFKTSSLGAFVVSYSDCVKNTTTNVFYSDLQTAFDKAAKGNTITVLDDVTLSEALTTVEDLTLVVSKGKKVKKTYGSGDDSVTLFTEGTYKFVTSTAPEDVAVGDTLVMGSIPSSDTTYGGMNVTWKVLFIDKGNATVISEKVLLTMAHQTTSDTTYSWKDSRIYNYLNNSEDDGFVKQYGLSGITMVTQQASLGNVYLLSTNELNNDEASNVAYGLDGTASAWSLRDAGNFSDNYVCYVKTRGNTAESRVTEELGVRPAFDITIAQSN